MNSETNTAGLFRVPYDVGVRVRYTYNNLDGYDGILPSPRCNLNSVMQPETPLPRMLLDVSYTIMLCTVEKCSSSSAISEFKWPILSWRSLTTKPNRVPSWEQNLTNTHTHTKKRSPTWIKQTNGKGKKYPTDHNILWRLYEVFKVNMGRTDWTFTCTVRRRPTRSFSRPRLPPEAARCETRSKRPWRWTSRATPRYANEKKYCNRRPRRTVFHGFSPSLLSGRRTCRRPTQQ